MPLYRVRWEIDIEADNPLEAAKKARYFQTKPNTTATVFDVFENDEHIEAFDLTEGPCAQE